MVEGGPFDKKTGEKVYTPTGATYTRVKYRDPVDGKLKETSPGKVKKLGYEVVETKVISKTVKSTRMAEEKDARALSSGRPIEEVYCGYANDLKALGNTARRSTVSVTPIPYSPSAKKAYQKEVDTLNANLNIALKNAPLERQAQILANSIVRRKQEASPDMTDEELKKIKNQALAEARVRTGAKKTLIPISDREWAAIQAGAISTSKLTQILDNADLNRVKQLATPRSKSAFSTTKLNKAKLLLSSGATQAEVAESLGVSVRVLQEALYTEGIR
jgi:hypothetical protein